jgi:hypothetical protein
MPPIGSSTNAETSCSPCAEQPVDCTKAVSELNATVCSLKVQYAEMLRKYGRLQGKQVTQAQYIKQFLDEQARLRRLISELGGETSGCGNDAAETADAVLVCDGGVPKEFVPGSDCARIMGKEGKWKVGGPNVAWLSSAQALAAGNNFSLTDYTKWADKCCNLFAIVQCVITLTGGSGAGGYYIPQANSIAVCGAGFSGGGTDVGAGQAIVPMNGTQQIFIGADTNFVGGTATLQSFLLGWILG